MRTLTISGFLIISLVLLILCVPALKAGNEISEIIGDISSEISSQQNPDSYLIQEGEYLNITLEEEIAESHAEFVHKVSDVQLIRELCPKNGGIMRFKNPKQNIVLEVCKLPDGKIGFRFWKIMEGAWKESSAFPKDSFTCITDVLKWCMKNNFFKWTGLMK